MLNINVLHKVRINTILELRKNFLQFYRLGRCPAQSRNCLDKMRMCLVIIVYAQRWNSFEINLIYFRKGKEKRTMKLVSTNLK